MTRPRNRRISRYSSAPKAEEIDEIYSLFNSDDDFNVNIEERKALLKQRARIRKQSQTSRQHNESTSSDIIECEEIVVEKQFQIHVIPGTRVQMPPQAGIREHERMHVGILTTAISGDETP